MELTAIIIFVILLTANENEVLSIKTKIRVSTRSDCRCGEIGSKLGARILGTRSKKHAYPWQALVLAANDICGGSVINDFYILTAGHCAATFQKNEFKIVLGVYDQYDLTSETNQHYTVDKIIVHKDFVNKRAYLMRDIALLKLNRQITFNKFVKPICLANPNEQIEGKTVTVIGWGCTKSGKNAPLSQFLQETQLKVLSKKTCLRSQIGKYLKFDVHSMFCASGIEKDACAGDSGGPMFYITPNGIAVEIGIISWGIKCGKYPGVYTTVSAFHNWILKHTQDASYCKHKL